MARRLFATGCWILIVCGLVHLLGHYQLTKAVGQSEAERHVLGLMRSYRQDLGLGFVRSPFDLLKGFSLAFSAECLGFGALGLVLMRLAPGFPPVLRATATVLTLVFGAMTVVAFTYWFVVPLSFLMAAFACFGMARAAARPPG